MLKYLIIPLNDEAPSFCHYSVSPKNKGLISLENLQEAIIWAMKRNVTIQFIYPNEEIPSEYQKLIDSISHVNIVGLNCKDMTLIKNADIIVSDGWYDNEGICDNPIVIRTNLEDLLLNQSKLYRLIDKNQRIVIVLSDAFPSMSKDNEKKYKFFLKNLGEVLKRKYSEGSSTQLNILTDRIFLDEMNNCNAGVENITLAPDGNFYICPGFYYDGYGSVGNLKDGLDIVNPHLYKLDYAPICKKCDAYQCRRCVWLNRKSTLEVNTPSHEQCVTAHLERNASREFLDKIREIGTFMPDKEIKPIDYLDPFDTMIQ